MARGTNVEVRPEGLWSSLSTNAALVYLWHSLPNDRVYLCLQNAETLIFDSNLDYVDFRSHACANLDIFS